MRKIYGLSILLIILLSSCSPEVLSNNDHELNEIRSQISEIREKINSLGKDAINANSNESISGDDKKYEDLLIRVKSIEDKLHNIEEQIKATVDTKNVIDIPIILNLYSTWDSIDYQNRTTEVDLIIENSKAQSTRDLIIDFYLNDSLLHIMPYPKSFEIIKKDGQDVIMIKYKIPYIFDRMVVRVYDKLQFQMGQTEFFFSDLGD